MADKKDPKEEKSKDKKADTTLDKLYRGIMGEEDKKKGA